MGPYRTTQPQLPNVEQIIETRTDGDIPEIVHVRLLAEASKIISTWNDPEIEPHTRLFTRNKKAAAMLISSLRTAGYQADYHWQGGSMGCVGVQFALPGQKMDRTRSWNATSNTQD